MPYYAGYLTLATAIPLIGLPRGATPDWRALLDGLAVVAVFGALAWRFLVQPAIADAGDGLQMVLIAGYPVVDMAVMAMLVITLYQRTGGRSAHQFTVLAIAAGVLIATDSGYLTWALRAEVPDPSLLDLGWLATYCLFGMLPLFRHEAPTRVAKSRAVATFRLALPYAITIPFAFGAFADASKQGGVPILLTGLIAATSLILVRQWFTLAENVRLRQQAEYLARHDGLTGLLSREAWFEEIQDAQQGRIAMLDIDHFKRINDMHGHPAGDHVLATVAQRLAATLPSASHLGRVGGEEFAAFFPATDSDVRQECEDALAAVWANPVELADGSQLSISVSVGLADLETGTSALQTYRLADELLYCAKQEGRNRLRSA
jgi:diguanylate cyclase (GGDEF)-like protein